MKLDKTTQIQIAEAAGISETSLRYHIRYLTREVLEIPDARWERMLRNYILLTKGDGLSQNRS